MSVRQETERLKQERQRLAEDLEREREERVKSQRQAEQQQEERARLERELRRSRTAARDRDAKPGASRSWRRRPLLLASLLFGALIAWFTSLVVALNVLAS